MRKDLRNGRESGRWKPYTWSGARVRTYMRHVEQQIILECCDWLGTYEGNLLAAEVLCLWSARLSAALLHQEGILMYGEMVRSGNTSSTPRE